MLSKGVTNKSFQAGGWRERRERESKGGKKSYCRSQTATFFAVYSPSLEEDESLSKTRTTAA